MTLINISFNYIVGRIYIFLAALFSGEYTFIVLGDDEVPLAGPKSARVSIWWFAALVFIVSIASAYIIRKKRLIERLKELEGDNRTEDEDLPRTIRELRAEIEALENAKVSEIELDQ